MDLAQLHAALPPLQPGQGHVPAVSILLIFFFKFLFHILNLNFELAPPVQ